MDLDAPRPVSSTPTVHDSSIYLIVMVANCPGQLQVCWPLVELCGSGVDPYD
jgi:hypothetical protein